MTSSRLSFWSREKVPSGMKSSMLWSKLSVWRLVIFCREHRPIENGSVSLNLSFSSLFLVPSSIIVPQSKNHSC